MIPLGGRVLCKEVETPEGFGKIVLLDDTLKYHTQNQAEVVAVGEGGKDDLGYVVPTNPDLKPGAWIIIPNFARTEYKDGLFWVWEDDIMAVLS